MTRRVTVAAVAGVSMLAGCAETTVDTSRTTAAPADAAATVFAPSGPAMELLPELSTELSRLSALIVANEGDEESFGRIEALWAAARGEVAQQRPELIDGFERAIGLAQNGVERRRPADADKAFRHLTSLVDAYVGDG